MRDTFLTVGIMLGFTLAGVLCKRWGIPESSIILLYVLATLLVSRFVNKRIWGVIATIMSVLMFNYFLVEPIYSFDVNGKDYPAIFTMMLVVSLVTSTLTDKVKQEAKLSKEKEQHTKKLYEISHNLLVAKNLEQTKLAVAVNVAEVLNYSTVFYTQLNEKTEFSNFEAPFIYNLLDDEEKGQNALTESERKNAYKAYLEAQVVYSKEGQITYFPIIGQERVIGVIGLIGMQEQCLSKETKLLLKAIIAQITIALEREASTIKQQQLNMMVESEQLKANMLRAISHDIRTPLTGILGATTTLIKGREQLREDKQINLLQGIYDDAVWLVHSVENILNITRLDDGRLVLHKHMEVAEEIIESVMQKLHKIEYKQLINIHLPDELIMVPMDAILIVQVLYNLLDNAIKYTPDESVIDLSLTCHDKYAVFSVEDRGVGIENGEIEHIFERFYRIKMDKNKERSGIGLGLTICKGIVEAHGGKIEAFNNAYGGATFRFKLPMEGDGYAGE